MSSSKLIFLFAGLILSINAIAKSYYVSIQGDDSNPGTELKPFRTIQQAAGIMRAGDVCFIREGIYHESVIPAYSGTEGNPIQFRAYKGENVIINGTKQVNAKWKYYKNGIYKTKVDIDKIEQLFANTEMMIEARWPNMKFSEVFDRSKWEKVDVGSKHGMVLSETVAKTGIDFTGAEAYLNVAHQWWTWNRKITKHKAGSNQLFYDDDLVGLCNFIPEYGDEKWLTKVWGDDYFYLFGILGVLDVENEWYFDENEKELYFYPPNGKKPESCNVRYKTIDYGFYANEKDYIEIEGIKFFACSFRFEDCNYCKISNLEMKYPTYSRTITEFDQDRKESVITKIVGDNNVVDHISITYCNNLGLMVMGNNNVVNNSIIHDINWSGTLIYPALQIAASPHLGVNWFNTIQYPPTTRTIENGNVTSFNNVASNNTLYNCGGPVLVYHAAKSIVEYNRIYDGGKACKDVSLIYGCWPFSHSSIVRYNWVHGCNTDHFSGRGGKGGIGIRADDQSRHNIIHNNVIWDCGEVGIVAKGEDHIIYNNTIIDIPFPILLPNETEPFKEWAVQFPQLHIQNQWSKVFNNIAHGIRSSRKPEDILSENENIFCNLTNFTEIPLVDIHNNDFRPISGSSLVDKGCFVSPVEIKFNGNAPDLGAYEADGDKWIPGAKWKEKENWMSFLDEK